MASLAPSPVAAVAGAETGRRRSLLLPRGMCSSSRLGARVHNQGSSEQALKSNSKKPAPKRRLTLGSRGIVWSDDATQSLLDEARSRIGSWHADMMLWRRQIHSQPELAFQEHVTSDLVANLLVEWGYEVDRTLGGTGVVGTLRTGGGGSAVMLRADMDALPIGEANDFEHRSQSTGTMHACGHDGHTAMLLGAARKLAKKRSFLGTIHLVFQPAEEGTPTDNKYGLRGGGAEAMLKDGLLAKYPVRAAFGLHNWPGLPVGHMAVHSGPVMAGVENFTIEVDGVGCHAAMPHLATGSDAVVCAAHIITALQARSYILSVVSRRVDPQESAVVSVTQVHGGDAYNVIPPTVILRGTIRTFKKAISEVVKGGVVQVAESTAAAYGCSATVRFLNYFPPTVNSPAEAAEAADAAKAVVGANLHMDTMAPSMGAEDFGYILQNVEGCYVWLGNGPTEGGCRLHNPRYDFNDDILALGASYWVQLVENALPLK
eukprot:SM000013S26525  [mRNA]  locus=s13:848178:852464:- [translate_table: standard]